MRRRAVIICTGELLREGLGPLFDAGLTVARSFESDAAGDGVVVLGIEGEPLPSACADEGVCAPEVTIEFTTEAYGRQRVTRVSAIKLTGRTLLDICPTERARLAA
jgi:hypothetical protein